MIFQTNHPKLEARCFHQNRRIQTSIVFPERKMHVPEQRQGFYQCPRLKQHPASDMQLLELRALQSMQILPKNANLAGGGFQDSD